MIRSRRLTIIGGAAGQLASRSVGVALGVVVAAVLTRYLGPSRYGILASAFALLATLNGLRDGGTGAVALRDMSRAESGPGPLFAVQLYGGLLLCLVGVALSFVIFDIGSPLIAAIVVLLALPASSGGAFSVYAQSQLRQSVGAGAWLLQSLLWAGAAIACSRYGWGLPAIAGLYVLTILAQSACAWMGAYRGFARVPVNIRQAVNLYRASLPLLMASIFVTVYYKVDAILVYKLGSAREAGLYSAAYKFLDSYQILPATALSVLLPLMAVRKTGAEAVQRVESLRTAAHAVILVASAASMLLISGSSPIISAVYGREFAAAAGLLAILAPAGVLITVGYICGAVLTAANALNRLVRVAAVAAVFNVAVNLAFIPSFGARAAAVTTTLTEALVAAQLLALLRAQGLGLRLGRTLSWALILLTTGWLSTQQSSAALAVAMVSGAAVACVADNRGAVLSLFREADRDSV